MLYTPTSADYRARIRWVRMCMAPLLMQGDMATARETAAATPRKLARW